MFKNYTPIWLLLSLSLAILLWFSVSDSNLSIGNYSPKKAPLLDFLKVDSADSLYLANDEAESLLTDENVVVTDSAPQSIFIFGDSMTYNLALRLAQYAKQNGHTIHSVNWDSSNTKIWADCDTLAYYIRLYKPTQIYITLGSNELYVTKPETRLPYIKRILQQIDTIPYVWIGPPNWKEDSGINDLLERTCKKGSFFRSAGMEFKRKADKIHPTRESSALWADSIMRWTSTYSAHPYLVESPSDSIKKANPNIVFLKALNK